MSQAARPPAAAGESYSRVGEEASLLTYRDQQQPSWLRSEKSMPRRCRARGGHMNGSKLMLRERGGVASVSLAPFGGLSTSCRA